jgi:PAT family beta-lactamase induction signal transducer AmpG
MARWYHRRDRPRAADGEARNVTRGTQVEGAPLNLTDRRHLRTSVLCLLYFCQGFPWGFATIALLATLSEAGIDKAETATITAMAMLPWTFKFFWAPLIDSVRFPSLGVRRPWIVFAQLGMAATLLGAWGSGALSGVEMVAYLAWVLFFHNCFASLQDVATDALSLDLLEERERGRVVGYMWASKVAGISAGGAGLAVVIARHGMEVAIAAQALFILAVCGLVIAVRERRGEKTLPWSAGAAQGIGASQQFGLSHTIINLKRALSTRTTFTLLIVASTALVAEGLYDPVTTEFFVQRLGWSAETFGATLGTWGVAGELIGALSGGYLASRFHSRKIALLGLALIMTTLLGFSLTSWAWDEPGYPHAVLLPAFRGSVAFTTVALFAVYMKGCWTAAAATQFTLYMALMNIAYYVGARVVTWLPAAGISLSYAQYYLVGGLLPLVAFGLLLTINRAEEAPGELEAQAA